MKLLTLQEMAAMLGVSAQTFRKDVRERNIPLVTVGKRSRFDPVKVQAYLESQSEQPLNIIKLKLPAIKPRRSVPVSGSRFAQQLNGNLPR